MGLNKVAYQKSASWVLDQLHSNNMEFHGWGGGGPTHYVFTPTRVEVELGCDTIIQIQNLYLTLFPKNVQGKFCQTKFQKNVLPPSLHSDPLPQKIPKISKTISS